MPNVRKLSAEEVALLDMPTTTSRSASIKMPVPQTTSELQGQRGYKGGRGAPGDYGASATAGSNHGGRNAGIRWIAQMERIELAEVAKIDRTVATDEECATLPYVGLEHIEKETGHFAPEFVGNPETLLATKFKFSLEHVLYGKLRPYLNKVALPYFDGVCTTEILPLLPKTGKLDRVYLWAFLLSPEFVQWASASVSGANLPRIDPKLLAEYPIPLPSLPEQRRIAAMLAKADRLRRLRRYALEISESYLQSVFVQMFGDPVTNPMGWDVSTVEGIATKVTDGEHATPQRIAAGIKLLSARNVQNGYIDFEAGLDYIPQYEYDRIKKRCNPEFGDILISCSGTVGRVTTVEIHEPFTMVRSAALVKPDLTKVVPKYLELYLRTDYCQDAMKKSINQSSQANLFIGPIMNLPVLLPDLPLQQRFAGVAVRYKRLRTQQREALRQAEHLFHTLLHKAFRGELGASDREAVETALAEELARNGNGAASGELEGELVQTKLELESL